MVGRMVVIADDITGAAEIAGIAFSHGQQVRLLCGCSGSNSSVCSCGTATSETIVIATDTRSMSESEAIAETRHIASSFLIPHFSFLIYKKTDSALRGHVVAELTALMQATGYQRCVYLPANPSKGRIIKNGVYYIREVRGERSEVRGERGEVRDVPIHETAFSYDPEFPALTSVLSERFPDAESKGIIMPDAENEEDIQKVIATYNDGNTIFAGAADLFSALLAKESRGESRGQTLDPSLGQRSCPHDSDSSLFTLHSSLFTLHSSLILCGSTQSQPLDLGIPIAPMPREIYDGSDDLSCWDTHEYTKQHRLILTMPYTHRTGKEAAVHLRTMMAKKAKELITLQIPDHLIIEGGATAWSTLQALGWTQFDIVAQIASGVVQMSVTMISLGSKKDVMVTLKPGSYPWGNWMRKIEV